MADLHPIGVRAGAKALLNLVAKVGEISNESFAQAYPGDLDIPSDADLDGADDPNDYRAIGAVVEAALHRAMVSGDPTYRQGFVRALTVLLVEVNTGGFTTCLAARGDPIKVTARAFSEHRG